TDPIAALLPSIDLGHRRGRRIGSGHEEGPKGVGAVSRSHAGIGPRPRPRPRGSALVLAPRARARARQIGLRRSSIAAPILDGKSVTDAHGAGARARGARTRADDEGRETRGNTVSSMKGLIQGRRP